MILYENCRRLCEECGKDLDTLLSRAGLSGDTVSRMKTIIPRPQTKTINMLADIVGVYPIRIIHPEYRIVDGVYTMYNRPIKRYTNKLEVLVANSRLTNQEFATACGLSVSKVRHPSSALSSAQAERVSRYVGIPMYVILDNNEPLRDGQYTKQEVDRYTHENIVYNLRAIYYTSGQKCEPFCRMCDIRSEWFRGVLTKMPKAIHRVPYLAENLKLSVKELTSDYTTSPIIHDAFCQMTPLQRMLFMMGLKGVTPEYIVETFSWPSVEIFSGKPDAMTMEVPYILAQYFQCPNAWFTKDTITLEPGQTLRTRWNTVI